MTPQARRYQRPFEPRPAKRAHQEGAEQPDGDQFGDTERHERGGS
jgi:hypothetical protein